MAYDYGTTQIGGQDLNLNELVQAGDMSSILELLGLPSEYGSKLGVGTLGSDVKTALDPSSQMYQQRITGKQQEWMPSLMQGALSLGSGVAGGLGRSERSFGTRQQAGMQPYLSQLAGVYGGISSDVQRAQGMATNWLSDVLSGYRELDYQAPAATGGEVPMYGGMADITSEDYENYITEQMEGFNLDFSNVDFSSIQQTICTNQGGQWNPGTQTCE